MIYGNPESQEAHEAACNAARDRQAVRFAVAPERHLNVPRGRLRPGDEVLLSDLVDPVNGTSPVETMAQLVAAYTVIEATQQQMHAGTCPADAPFRVANKALVVKRGILSPGAQILPTDVEGGEPHLLRLVDRGLVLRHATT
jgi:hypothetical protein